MKARVGAEGLAALLLAIVLTVAGSAVGRFEANQADLRASTLVSQRDGWMALHRMLERLELPVSRSRSAAPEGAPSETTRVIAAPSVPLTSHETGQLLDWVADGGRLVLALDHIPSLTGPNTRLVRAALGVDGAPNRSDFGRLTFPEDTPVHAPRRTLRWEPEAVIQVEEGEHDSRRGELVPWVRFGADALVLHADFGLGEVVLISESRPFSNEFLRDDGLAYFATELLAAAGTSGSPRTIEFDEFHHGFRRTGEAPSMASELFRALHASWPGRGVLVLVLAFLVYAVGAGVVHGTALRPPPPARRQLTEHADALALLFESAGARDEALDILATATRREIGSKLGFVRTTTDAEFDTRLRDHPAPGAAELAEVLTAIRTARSTRDADFVDLARRLTETKQRLLHGTA